MRNHDPDHFQILLQRYEKRVYRMVASILGPDNAAETEDVVQDVFISVYFKIRGFRNDCPFSSWILTIARNRAIDHLRKIRRGPLYFGNEEIYDLLTENPASDSETVASARERRNILLRCVRQLSIQRRAAVYLYYWIGCTQAEIAGLLHTNVQVVKSQLFRARRQLGEKLEVKQWSYV